MPRDPRLGGQLAVEVSGQTGPLFSHSSLAQVTFRVKLRPSWATPDQPHAVELVLLVDDDPGSVRWTINESVGNRQLTGGVLQLPT